MGYFANRQTNTLTQTHANTCNMFDNFLFLSFIVLLCDQQSELFTGVLVIYL